MQSPASGLRFSEPKRKEPLSKSPRPEELQSDPAAKAVLASRLYSNRSAASRLSPRMASVSRPSASQALAPASASASSVPAGPLPHPPTLPQSARAPRIPFGASVSHTRGAAPPAVAPSSTAPAGASPSPPARTAPPPTTHPVDLPSSSTTAPPPPPARRAKRDILKEIPCYRPKEYPIEESTIMVPNWDDIVEHEHFLDSFRGDDRFASFRENPDSFLYLYPVARNPFNMRILEAFEVNKDDYYTLTHSGLLHSTPDDTGFTPLDQYDREYHLFYKTRKIRFFRFYTVCKTFLQWRANVRESKSSAYKENLQKELFVLDPQLKAGLDKLTLLCADLKRLELFEIDPFHTYTLEEFEQVQQRKRDMVVLRFEEFKQNVRGAVRVACAQSLRDHLRRGGFGERPIGEKREISFTERAAMRTQCRKLARFIRMVDFMIVDTLLNLCIHATGHVFRSITTPTRQTIVEELQAKSRVFSTEMEAGLQPLFVMNLLPNNEVLETYDSTRTVTLTDFAFDPPPDDFRMKVESLVYDVLRVVTVPERLLTHDDFIDYLRPVIEDDQNAIGEGINLEQLVIENADFQTLLDQITDHLSISFQGTVQHTEVFCNYLQSYNVAYHDLKQMSKEYFTRFSVEELIAAFDKYKRFLHLFNNMPESDLVDIIVLDLKTMKEQFIPLPRNCLDRMTDLVPQIFGDRTSALFDDVSRCLKIISAIPASVDDFVDNTTFTRETNERLGEIDEEMHFLSSLSMAMEEYEIPIAETDNSKTFLLNQALYNLKTTLSATDSRFEDNTKKFSKEIDEMIPKIHLALSDMNGELNHAMFSTLDSNPEVVLEYAGKLAAKVKQLSDSAKKYQHYQEVLKLAISMFDDLDEVERDLMIKTNMWTSLYSWSEQTSTWTATPFSLVDPDAIGKVIQVYMKTALQSESGLPGNKVASRLKQIVLEFKSSLPVVTSIRCPELKERHWDRIHSLLGYKIHGVDGFTLGELIQRRANAFASDLETIAMEAIQESVLEGMLKSVDDKWKNVDFEVVKYKEQNDVFILGSVDDIVTLLEDSLVTMSTILGSRFVGPIRKEVDEKHHKLNMLQKILDEWLVCQKQWMYLENIFSAPDIQRQLPKESKLFQTVDKGWKAVMKKTFDDPLCIRTGTSSMLLDNLRKYNGTLDNIQKSLEDYLETKRCAFPRFYFLSNDELLQILSQTREPQAVQPHLRKCFDNIVRLHFGEEMGSIDIVAMESSEKEVVALGKNLKARGNVEDWLSDVESHMRAALQKAMVTGVKDYSSRPRPEWVMNPEHPGQVIATVAQIMWCTKTEKALRSENVRSAMKKWNDRNVADLRDLTKLVRGSLTPNQRLIIIALVTTDVHARDIVQELVRDQVTSVVNFGWEKQLRYYLDQELVVSRQSNAVIPYGYEYQGCTTRLVITPLTDRCWMTLTGALNLRLGGNPAGPAGTGKTESSKDLAKALAILCIVFNCSEQIDYVMMGKLFSGLAQCGCWTCLDEFNRIDIEVLSVIAQQLLVIRQARLSGQSDLKFEGRQIALRDGMHVIITMNPGYAGRTELPDNLKVLFRPVAMMVPDYALIAEIMLFAEGFDDARELSRKMTKLYKLCSEQLSQQCHYDYGLRAVKSVLVMAGGLKRSSPDLSEDVVLIRAMRDSNVPKFLSDDLPLFFGILQDLFPGVVVPSQDIGVLLRQVDIELRADQMQPEDAVEKKIIQIYETMNVRFGMVLVGPSGSGKSTAIQVLSRALTHLREAGAEDAAFQRVSVDVINPKCITMGELYGENNELTQVWVDGLASTIMRRNAMDESPDKRWLVFDGPIDALWIENMNTVLDDNMTLCLANGERIKLKPQMRMLFEVGDLDAASPATVSRLGVVFVASDILGWRPVVLTWLEKTYPSMSAEEKERFLYNIDAFVPAALGFLRSSLHEPIATQDQNLVMSLCSIFQTVYRPFVFVRPKNEEDEERIEEERQYRLHMHVDQLFSYSFLYSFGTTIDPSEWPVFDSFYHDQLEEEQLDVGYASGLCYDYFLNAETMEFKEWSTVVPKFTYQPELPYFQIVVPTVDTTRFSHFLRTLVRIGKAVFFTGVTGTGKTVIMDSTLDGMKQPVDEGGDQIFTIELAFSARTDSSVTQNTIENALQKQRKNLLAPPPPCTRAVISIDDINMPAVEQYGAQPPIELLRQFITFNGFYDRKALFWKDIANTSLVAAAAPPGGGRSKLSQRLTRRFNLFCLPPASIDAMTMIYSSIVGGFLQSFLAEVKGLSFALVNGTIDIYTKMSQTLRPTPAKFHYTFNLRDVSKIFQGILMMESKFCSKADTMTRLWVHETMRVFHDRLVTVEDKDWFKENIVQLLQRYFHVTVTPKELFEDAPLLFGDYMKIGVDFSEKKYDEIHDQNKVVRVFQDYMDQYNLDHSNQLRLVFFSDAIDHISRILRIVRQPRGNAMLVGVGGSGKQSLTRLACFISGLDCYQIEITRGYNLESFRENLKELMVKTGVDGERTAFLFTDSQIMQESFLEDINSILNSGEVPNLFAVDEMEKVLSDMVPVLKKLNLPQSRDMCQSTFVNRVRDCLHVVLCMSPVGDALRIRCRQFPSLINCCTIDWFHPWPEEALRSVAGFFFRDLEIEDQSVSQALVESCVMVHTSIDRLATRFYDELRRKVYTTPKSYLDLIELYAKLLDAKKSELSVKLNRLEQGVQKLKETNDVVDGLRGDLTALQPILEAKSRDSDELIEKVTKESAEAAEIKEKVEAETAIVQRQQEEVAEAQSRAQQSLDTALPALEEAKRALDSLDKKDIAEIKAFKTPPPGVQVVMESVNILLDEKPDWDSAKRVLSRTEFIKLLQTYDKENIPPRILQKLQKYIDNPVMNPDNVRKISVAAYSLCKWVHAISAYAKVFKEIEPLRLEVDRMNEELRVANEELSEKTEKLSEIEARVEALQEQSDAVSAEKQKISEDIEITRKRLERAEKLTKGLAAEGVRWSEQVVEGKERQRQLIGDVFLSSACVSYYGPFTGVYREEVVSEWMASMTERKIPLSPSFSLMSTLGDPLSIQEWQIFGLPTDLVSTNNSILTTKGKRWPLLIDPQGQANRWIRNWCAKVLTVTKLHDVNLLRTLENCIRVGRTLLIEDLGESLVASLEPVLTKQIHKQGGRYLIHLGDADIDYDPQFQLFLTTKLSNPHYLPEVYIRVNIINFTVTIPGLEDQLLGLAVKKEASEVEEKRAQLVASMADDQKQLSSVQSNILRLLSESTGNILDDEVLINTLAQSQMTAQVISDRVGESQKTEAEINLKRNQYRPVALRGAILYFVVSDLSGIDPMYQNSLNYFNRLFNICMDESAKSIDLEVRLKSIIDYLTKLIYNNICRGLFEKDKLLFSFLICVSILRNEGVVHDAEWFLLLRGAAPFDRAQQPENPSPETVTPVQWDILYTMQLQLPGFGDLCRHMLSNWSDWERWIASADPATSPLPAPFEEKTSAFQRLIFLRVLREDHLIFAISSYVSRTLGRHMIEKPSVSMEEVHSDMDPCTPCIFVLSTGADPTSLLLRFAEEKGMKNNLFVISLGQGQGPKAESLVESAGAKGDWVLLQNCHLAKSWMPELEKMVLSLPTKEGGLHSRFRLFLTSMPVEYFPAPVLQSGVKLTNEPPKGLQSNLLRSYETLIDEETFTRCSKPEPWRKLLFGLSFFHANIQERRKFGPLGWNILYEFNDSDLETSVQVLRLFLDEQESIPWDALQYVVGHINYGGRVTDDWDRRCLISILDHSINPGVLQDRHPLSASGLYSIPPSTSSYSDTLDYIRGLPSNEDPEIFGMHPNASLTYQKQEVTTLLSTLLSIQPRTSSGGVAGKSSDEIVMELSSDLEEQIPEALSSEKASVHAFQVDKETGLMNSLSTVLSQEMVKFNRLLSRVKSTLGDLKKAIQGLIVMSNDLDSMYVSFLGNRVPEIWHQVAYPSLKPLASWVKDLISRVEFIRSWILQGPPMAFPLPAFFFPQGFMTGALQVFARKYRVPINSLDFTFRLYDSEDVSVIHQAPTDGVVVYGLSMEGARWDRTKRSVQDSRPGELYSVVPPIHFLPVKDYQPNPAHYPCPVYKTTTRAGTLSTTGISTNFVVTVYLPTDLPSKTWIWRGVALLCNLND